MVDSYTLTKKIKTNLFCYHQIARARKGMHNDKKHLNSLKCVAEKKNILPNFLWWFIQFKFRVDVTHFFSMNVEPPATADNETSTSNNVPKRRVRILREFSGNGVLWSQIKSSNI